MKNLGGLRIVLPDGTHVATARDGFWPEPTAIMRIGDFEWHTNAPKPNDAVNKDVFGFDAIGAYVDGHWRTWADLRNLEAA